MIHVFTTPQLLCVLGIAALAGMSAGLLLLIAVLKLNKE